MLEIWEEEKNFCIIWHSESSYWLKYNNSWTWSGSMLNKGACKMRASSVCLVDVGLSKELDRAPLARRLFWVNLSWIMGKLEQRLGSSDFPKLIMHVSWAWPLSYQVFVLDVFVEYKKCACTIYVPSDFARLAPIYTAFSWLYAEIKLLTECLYEMLWHFLTCSD